MKVLKILNNLFKSKRFNILVMEINYNTIMQYLCDDNIENSTNNDNFPTKKNIMVSSDNFPKEFSSLFETKNKFYRYGVLRYDNYQNNISFLTSFLTLIDKQFITLDKKEELLQILQLITQLKEKINDKKFKFELKSKFEKHLVLEKLETLNLEDGVLLQALIQVLDINLLVFDFKDLKISSLFNGDYFDPWKVTLLMAKKDKNWEPLFSEKKQFSYNDSFLKKILTNEEISYYNEEYLGKYYSLLDNLNEIADINNEDQIETDEDMETFINPLEEIKNMNLNKTKLKNMKKDKIFELLSRLDDEVNKDDKKDNMISSLLSYI